MIGRLLGANEMAVALLSREENETAVRVAGVLEAVSGFFLEDVAGRAALGVSETGAGA